MPIPMYIYESAFRSMPKIYFYFLFHLQSSMTWIKMNVMRQWAATSTIGPVKPIQKKMVHVARLVAVPMRENHKEIIQNHDGMFTHEQ